MDNSCFLNKLIQQKQEHCFVWKEKKKKGKKVVCFICALIGLHASQHTQICREGELEIKASSNMFFDSCILL